MAWILVSITDFPILKKVSVGLGGVVGLFFFVGTPIFDLRISTTRHFVTTLEVVVCRTFCQNLILDFQSKSIPATTVQNQYLSDFQNPNFLIFGSDSGFNLKILSPEKS